VRLDGAVARWPPKDATTRKRRGDDRDSRAAGQDGRAADAAVGVAAVGGGTIPPDGLWQHDLAHLVTSVGVLAGMAMLCLAAATVILARTLARTR
jgi:hypothetical protein